jgi:hypothetical protein
MFERLLVPLQASQECALVVLLGRAGEQAMHLRLNGVLKKSTFLVIIRTLLAEVF